MFFELFQNLIYIMQVYYFFFKAFTALTILFYKFDKKF